MSNATCSGFGFSSILLAIQTTNIKELQLLCPSRTTLHTLPFLHSYTCRAEDNSSTTELMHHLHIK
jgi:hypothetical protein